MTIAEMAQNLRDWATHPTELPAPLRQKLNAAADEIEKQDIQKAILRREVERLRDALSEILKETAAPVNEMAQREAVHFAYNVAKAALS